MASICRSVSVEVRADGKLIPSDVRIAWGTIKYGGVPVPSLVYVEVEVWKSPMHVAIIRCIFNQKQPMLHVLDSCYESGVPHLRNFTFQFNMLQVRFSRHSSDRRRRMWWYRGTIVPLSALHQTFF